MIFSARDGAYFLTRSLISMCYSTRWEAYAIGQVIRIENRKQDSIGSIIGGNSYTTETTKYNFGKALYDTFFGKSSPHNCYGVNNYQCIKNCYRTDQIMHAKSIILDLKSKIKGK